MAQESIRPSYVALFKGLESEYVPNKMTFDSTQLQIECKQIIRNLQRKGYWLASIDQTIYLQDTVEIQFHQGRKFEAVEIDIINNSQALSRWPKFLKSKYQETESLQGVGEELESVLDYFEANGYPFAALTIDSSRLINNVLQLQLSVDPGTRITYDSLSVSPTGVIKTDFLSKYLGLNYGKNYDEKDLSQVEAKMQHLPFLSLQKMNTSFRLKKAKVHLEVARQKVNYFNGILGVIPDREGSGTEITGELDLAINNVFMTGKKIEVNWQKLDPASQQLHASYLHPILLGSPLDFNFVLDQIRQDTIYSNRSLQLAFLYRPTGNLQMEVNYESLLGNKLDGENDGSGDFDINYYGLKVTWFRLNDLYVPRRGFRTEWTANIGNKTVSNDQNIPESTQYRFQASLEWYKPLGKRSVLFLGQQNGIIFNDYLYLNDLYRLGGLRSIRGFNELEFFASKYAVINVEWRYYLDDNSYLVTFYDQSILSYEILNGSFEDRPAGLGIGMEFTTDSGNFKILYGLGKRKGEPFSFATSKIHFGYTAIF